MQPTIIIDGVSANGKSTLANYMAEKVNGVAVDGDPYMLNAIKDMPNEMKNLFGRTIRADEAGLEFIYNELYTTDKQIESLLVPFHDTVRPYVEENFYNERKKLSRLNTNAFIFAWVTASKFDKFWNEAEKRYAINTDVNQTINNAKNRWRGMGDSEWVMRIKYKEIDPIIRAAKGAKFIKNDGSLQQFQNKIDREILPEVFELIK
jgi:dephospho-CoA kinase